MAIQKAPKQRPIAQAVILEIKDKTVIVYEKVAKEPQPREEIDLGVKCSASGEINLYPIGIYTLTCLICDFHPEIGFEGGCKGCYADGCPPTSAKIEFESF